MANFLQLNGLGGDPVLVNTDAIASIHGGRMGSNVLMVTGAKIEVAHSLEELSALVLAKNA